MNVRQGTWQIKSHCNASQFGQLSCCFIASQACRYNVCTIRRISIITCRFVTSSSLSFHRKFARNISPVINLSPLPPSLWRLIKFSVGFWRGVRLTFCVIVKLISQQANFIQKGIRRRPRLPDGFSAFNDKPNTSLMLLATSCGKFLSDKSFTFRELLETFFMLKMWLRDNAYQDFRRAANSSQLLNNKNLKRSIDSVTTVLCKWKAINSKNNSNCWKNEIKLKIFATLSRRITQIV